LERGLEHFTIQHPRLLTTTDKMLPIPKAEAAKQMEEKIANFQLSAVVELALVTKATAGVMATIAAVRNIDAAQSATSSGTTIAQNMVDAVEPTELNTTKDVPGVEIISIAKTANDIEGFQPGLYIMRGLPDGNFEAFSLNKMSIDAIMSQGAGLELDTNLDRANAFHIPTYQWVGAIEKCALAARYSGKEIYSFP
jgi:hypothetical protein